MAYSYLFFEPKVLPLTASQLSEETVEPLLDLDVARASLGRVFPQLTWSDNGWARGETADGKWLEFFIAAGATLCMRCSLRADYRADVQRICDLLGWTAVDERPFVYQPGATPAPA